MPALPASPLPLAVDDNLPDPLLARPALERDGWRGALAASPLDDPLRRHAARVGHLTGPLDVQRFAARGRARASRPGGRPRGAV